MPLYPKLCRHCGEHFTHYASVEERNDVSCPTCGSTYIKHLIGQPAKGFEIEPQYFEHLDTEPVWIESKQHLKQECKKRGLWAKCLD